MAGEDITKKGALYDGSRWEATVNHTRTRCDWTLVDPTAGAAIIAKGTVTFDGEKYRPHVTSGQLFAVDQQELLIAMLDELPELRELSAVMS